jgi:hypothetical protein
MGSYIAAVAREDSQTKYDQLVFGDHLDELCTLLIALVNELIVASAPPRSP